MQAMQFCTGRVRNVQDGEGIPTKVAQLIAYLISSGLIWASIALMGGTGAWGKFLDYTY